MRGAAVLADRGHRLVLVGVEALLHALGERGSGGGELGPGSHGRAGGGAALHVQSNVEIDQHVRRGGPPPGIDRSVVLARSTSRSNGSSLASRAHFSRDHLDRLLAAATGESPVALRRRLLLERAAWQLRTGAAASDAAVAAGYGSLAAFSRAFARAYGAPPSAFDGEVELAAPNGIHFHPPAGLLLPGARAASSDLTDRMVRHHLDRVRELLAAAATLSQSALERQVRSGFVAVWFEGEEASAALMCERLVFTLEVWVAAMAGEPVPEAGGPGCRGSSGPPGVRAPGEGHPRPRRLRRRVRRRAVRAPAVVHLRRRVLTRPRPTAPSGARRSPPCWRSSAPRCRRSAIRSCGRTLRACGSGWPGTRRRPEGRRAPVGRCSRSGAGSRGSG